MTAMPSPARQTYEADGFYVHRQPLIPAELMSRAVAGMDAVRAGVYETGIPPQESAWNPGDDPQRLCKIEMSQVANHAIRDLVSHPRIGELAADLTGATMVQVWWTQLLYKPPDHTTEAPMLAEMVAAAAGLVQGVAGAHQQRRDESYARAAEISLFIGPFGVAIGF